MIMSKLEYLWQLILKGVMMPVWAIIVLYWSIKDKIKDTVESW